MAAKTTTGNFFEDFQVGQLFHHAVPRTVSEGDLALYIALTGDRRPLHCSRGFAQSLRFKREVVHDLLVFHLVFGRAVPDVSLNSPANLGYADVRFLNTVYPGDTLRAETEGIGQRETARAGGGRRVLRGGLRGGRGRAAPAGDHDRGRGAPAGDAAVPEQRPRPLQRLHAAEVEAGAADSLRPPPPLTVPPPTPPPH